MDKQVIETLVKISNEKIETKSSLIICYRNKEKESNSPNGYVMQITMLKDDIIDIEKAIDQLNKLKDFQFPTRSEVNTVIKNLEVSDGYAIAFMDGCIWSEEQVNQKLS